MSQFKSTLDYRGSPRTAGTTQKNPAMKNKQIKYSIFPQLTCSLISFISSNKEDTISARLTTSNTPKRLGSKLLLLFEVGEEG